MEEVTAILTENDKEIQPERHDEMRAMKTEIEAHLKQIMQEKMNELELKVDNKMDQLTKDLDGIKANLHAQSERLTNCEMQLKGVSDMKTVSMPEEMRGEFEKMKLEQTRLALKAKDDSEIIYTVKGRADAFIQLLEQKDERMIKELNEHKTNMMDEYKNHLKEVKTTIASVDTNWEKEPRALEQMETKIFDMMKDHYEWLGIMKQLRKDERRREMGQTNLNRTELVQKMERMEAQMQKYGDESRLMDNQMTTINKQSETFDNRVTEHENKLAAFDNKVTIMGNEVATIDSRVTADDKEITTINNNLVTIEKKVIATDNRMTTTDKKMETIDKRISTTDKKVDATDNQMTDIDKKVLAINNRLTWMENWQKKLNNIGIFGTLRQKDGCQVSEFSFTVSNIEAEITRARGNRYHRIESEPFYTNIMGYRAKLKVYPNDCNTNHVGVYLLLVEGEFDDVVSWPFNCKYEFHSVSRDGTQIAYDYVDPSTLTDSEEAFMRPPSNNSKGYGIGEYISTEKLLANKDQYVIDGGFSIKATIWLSN